jgi:hypothetical protein
MVILDDETNTTSKRKANSEQGDTGLWLNPNI